MYRLGLQHSAAMLPMIRGKWTLQTRTLLKNVKSRMARSKMPDVVTMVVEEQQRPSSGD